MNVVVNIYIMKLDVQKMSLTRSMDHDMSNVLGFENELMQIKKFFLGMLGLFFYNNGLVVNTFSTQERNFS